MPTLSLVNPSISFWQAKEHPMGVAIMTPHPYVVNITHPISWRPCVKFQLGCAVNLLLVAKMTSCVCPYEKTTPICGL